MRRPNEEADTFKPPPQMQEIVVSFLSRMAFLLGDATKEPEYMVCCLPAQKTVWFRKTMEARNKHQCCIPELKTQDGKFDTLLKPTHVFVLWWNGTCQKLIEGWEAQ